MGGGEMTEAIWPRQGPQLRQQVMTAKEFLLRKGTLVVILKLAVLLAIYLVGIRTPIPGVHTSMDRMREWWFLALADDVFTGGALGRGALLAMGNFAIPVLCLGSTHRKGIVSRSVGLLLIAAAITAFFLIRGEIALSWTSLAICFVCIAAGGLAVCSIDKQLLKLRVPDTLHVNVFLVLGLYLWRMLRQVASDQDMFEAALGGVATVVIVASAFYLFRDQILVDVMNIKTAASRRFARLALRSLSEVSLETFAVFCMIFFVCLGGLLSVLAGWRNFSLAPDWVRGLVSAVTFSAVVLLFGTLRRHLAAFSKPGLGLGFSSIIGPSPAFHARRMLRHFWIIEGVPAGSETEAHLEQHTRRLWRKTLVLLSVWMILTFGLQFYVQHYGSGKEIFPYSPLVSVALLCLATANTSMIGGDLVARYHAYKHMAQGRSRLFQETAPAASQAFVLGMGRRKGIDIGDADTAYWKQERIPEEVLGEVMDWMRLARQHSVRPPAEQQSPLAVTILRGVMLRTLIGGLSGALAGMIYVAFKPDGDVWQVIVSFALPPLISYEAFTQFAKRKRREGGDSE